MAVSPGGMMSAMQDKLGSAGGGAPPTPAGPPPDATPASDQALFQDFLTNDQPGPEDLIGVVKALVRSELSEGGEGMAPPAPPGGGMGGAPGGPPPGGPGPMPPTP